MSKKKELNEQELEQISGGHQIRGTMHTYHLYEKLFQDFNEMMLALADAQKRHPEVAEEFSKLFKLLRDPSIPNEEKERLKADFIEKYILN